MLRHDSGSLFDVFFNWETTQNRCNPIVALTHVHRTLSDVQGSFREEPDKRLVHIYVAYTITKVISGGCRVSPLGHQKRWRTVIEQNQSRSKTIGMLKGQKTGVIANPSNERLMGNLACATPNAGASADNEPAPAE